MQANAHEILLQECRDLFRERLLETVARTLEGMEEALFLLAEKATEARVRDRYFDARTIAMQHRDLIAAHFGRALMAEFQERVEESKQAAAAGSFDPDQLQIVGDDEMNETLSFNGMASRMRWFCEEEMGALDQRAAVLLGRPRQLDADANPFGARVVTDAFKQACQKLDCPLDLRLVILKSFENLGMDGIRHACREVNDVLVANAILPKISYGVTRNESVGSQPRPQAEGAVKAAGAPATAAAPVAPSHVAPSQQQDMFSMLSGLLAGPRANALGTSAEGNGNGLDSGIRAPGSGGHRGDGTGGDSAGGSGGQDLAAIASPAQGVGGDPGIGAYLGVGSNQGIGGLGAGGAPLLQGAHLMGSLTCLQRGDLSSLGEAAAELGPLLAEAGNLKNVLRELKSTPVGAGMGQMDAMTLEIVSMLFDALFEDEKIPVGMKALIGRLQLPLLKVAIADKELFSSKSHPARLLLDTLGQVGLRQPHDFGVASALFPRLAARVDTLVEKFQEDLGIFDQVRGELEGLIAQEDARTSREMAVSERQIEQTETLAIAKSEVQGELRARLQAHRATPRAVAEFLVLHWVKYLVVLRARDGRDTKRWDAAWETTEQLLWSVQPKHSPEERRKLGGTIPGLLRALKEGVTLGGIDEASYKAFFTELMKCHTDARRNGSVSAAVRAVEALAANDDLDFTAPVIIKNPFGDGRVEVTDDDLDFSAPTGTALAVEPQAQAAVAAKPARPPAVRLPSALVAGAWVSIGGPQGEQPARLHYVSPRNSHFLFVDRQGRKVFECSRSTLARRLKLEEIAMLPGEPDASLFDRILDSLFGKLRAPLAQAA